MNLEETVKAIRKLYGAISGKGPAEVSLTYKGLEYGVTEPWLIRIDSREAKAKDYMTAAYTLLEDLKNELKQKVNSIEQQADDYKKALKSLDN